MSTEGAERPTAYVSQALKACDQLLAEARKGELPSREWAIEDLEQVRSNLASRVEATGADDFAQPR